ncbi:hypothetical protein [Microbacterium sp. gxy059]|uniref:hypothetical protein n=1 Tax=Microbacterium sp. gxy059 TaxID=2957199 RepID=UPI003D99AA3C
MPAPAEGLGADGRTTTRFRRTAWILLIVLVGVLAMAYVVRLGWLTMMATEGDVPPSSAVELPAGATVPGESSDCASGGGWTTLTVDPPPGQTPEDLAEELGATPQLRIPGDFFDPRTVSVSANTSGVALVLTLDYWSQEWVP